MEQSVVYEIKKGRVKSNKIFQIDNNSILSAGYGSIPKRIMIDKRLSIESKAIYSYLCSYAGGGCEAYPSISRMVSDLAISENRFYRHFEYLIKLGYVRKHREVKENNLLGHNVYELVQVLE